MAVEPAAGQPQQWQTTPQQTDTWRQPTHAAAPPRPGGVTFAGIFLIILGVIALFGSALFFMGGALLGGLGDLGEMGGVFAAVAGVAGVVLLIWGLGNLLGGIGALQGKNWGRVTGIIVSVIAVVFGVLGLLGSLGAGGDASGMVISILVTAGYAFAAYALYKAGSYFAYPR